MAEEPSYPNVLKGTCYILLVWNFTIFLSTLLYKPSFMPFKSVFLLLPAGGEVCKAFVKYVNECFVNLLRS